MRHFFPWNRFPEYEREIPKDVLWTPEEKELQRAHGLSERQLSWRRWKLNQYDKLELFLQEFPLTLEEAFISRGECYFDKGSLRDYRRQLKEPVARGILMREPNRVDLRRDDKGPLFVYEIPRPGGVYLVAADSSEGTAEGDPAAAVVIDRENNRQVAWVSGALDPLEFAELLFSLGQWYGWAVLAVEDNGPGLATLLQLLNLAYPRLHRRRVIDDGSQASTEKLGWHTDQRTRPLILTELRRALRTHALGVVDAAFLNECSTFCKQLDGRWNANSGCHDDRVIAQAIASYLHSVLPLERSPWEEGGRDGNYPFATPPPRQLVRGWKTGY